MNYVMTWIQQDDFNFLHNMWGAKFSLLHNMQGAKCTICELQILSICWKSIVLQGRMNVPASACFACNQQYFIINWLYSRIFHNKRIFLQNINISDRIRFKTAQYCPFVSKFWTGISVHGDAEQEVVSHHPHCLVCAAASVLPFNPCQCATNCTVGFAA